MQNEYEKKEKQKKKSDLERNSIKKSTLSLSEIPNIIKDEFNSDKTPKENISNFLTGKALLYPTKLKNSFINAPINYEKDETPSSIVELKKFFELENEFKKDKSISKKEKENINKKGPSNENRLTSKRLKSSRILMKNRDKDRDNDFIKPTKTRKSDFTSTIKKNWGITDSPVKRTKRKSIISQPNVSPTKLYTTEIFKKFFSKKISFDENEKRNEDKIYINIPNKEELLITVNTAQETIKNYYEYMRECFQIIDLNFNKSIKLHPIEPVNFNFKPNKKTVVFELESTLVSYYIEDLNLDENSNSLGINIRPHLMESLDVIKKDYNIVIYSSGSKIYVDAILDFLDPKHEYFNFRLYREHCNRYIINNKIYFTKNLNIFKNICPLKDIVMVDCSVIGFGFFLENGIPIIPYYDSKEDVELKLLSYYLLSISSNNDLRIALKRDMELDYYFQEARKKNNENENILTNNIIINDSQLISPEPVKKNRKNESKTEKLIFSNYIHIHKRNSHSFENENKKNKIIHKGSKKRKKAEKEEDTKYKSPQKEKESLFKKKSTTRKKRASTQQKNFINLKSLKINSKEKGKKAETKKNLNKNI